MPQLVIDLPSNLYDLLRSESERTQQTMTNLVQKHLSRIFTGSLMPGSTEDTDQAIDTLRTAGLIVEPTEEQKNLAAGIAVTLDDVQAAFARAGGQSLSDIVIEQRGPKG